MRVGPGRHGPSPSSTGRRGAGADDGTKGVVRLAFSPSPTHPHPPRRLVGWVGPGGKEPPDPFWAAAPASSFFSPFLARLLPLGPDRERVRRERGREEEQRRDARIADSIETPRPYSLNPSPSPPIGRPPPPHRCDFVSGHFFCSSPRPPPLGLSRAPGLGPRFIRISEFSQLFLGV